MRLAQEEEPKLKRRRPRILVAGRRASEDAPLLTALRDGGYDVVEVRDGIQLISRLRAWVYELTARQPFDLVITDARMPAGFAYGVIETGGAPIPDGATAVLQPTGDSTSRRFGVSAVLEAPVELGELMSAVRSRLG